VPARTITFLIAAVVPQDAEEALIAAVGFVEGVDAAWRLVPSSTIPEVRRMGVAVLRPDARDPESVLTSIRELSGIESAQFAAERGMT
jgi:hypothetical protein